MSLAQTRIIALQVSDQQTLILRLAKVFTDVDERPILKQAEPSEQVSDMVEYQGGDGYGKFYVSAHQKC